MQNYCGNTAKNSLIAHLPKWIDKHILPVIVLSFMKFTYTSSWSNQIIKLHTTKALEQKTDFIRKFKFTSKASFYHIANIKRYVSASSSYALKLTQLEPKIHVANYSQQQHIFKKKKYIDNRSYLNHNPFQNILDESFAIIIGLFHCPKSLPTFQNALWQEIVLISNLEFKKHIQW